MSYRGYFKVFFAEFLEEVMGFLASAEDRLLFMDGSTPGTAGWELACSDGDTRRLFEIHCAY